MTWIAVLVLAAVLGQRVDGKVVVLTDANFYNVTKEGDFFIDIYAPWCSHCKQIEPIWEKISRRLQGQVHVAKIDGTKQTLLFQRFFVQKFPTLVLLKNGETRRYDGPRSEDQLVNFALDGWKQVDPWPFYMAPNSRFGRILGRTLELPRLVMRAYTYLYTTLKLPQVAIVLIFLSFPVLIGVAAICFLDYLHTSGARHFPDHQHAHAQ